MSCVLMSLPDCLMSTAFSAFSAACWAKNELSAYLISQYKRPALTKSRFALSHHSFTVMVRKRKWALINLSPSFSCSDYHDSDKLGWHHTEFAFSHAEEHFLSLVEVQCLLYVLG